MATVHDTRHGNTLGERSNQHGEHIVVTNNTGLCVVNGAQSFILSVGFFVAIVISDGASVSCAKGEK